ncbi:MAG: sulfite exporter TauE/SafE family protein, partial [Halieaceae bacterium]
MTDWTAFAITPDQMLWIAVSVGLAALIRAFTGFGFAMLVVPVFSLILTPGDAVVLSAVLALLLGLVSYRSWWGLFPLAPVVPMMAGAI